MKKSFQQIVKKTIKLMSFDDWDLDVSMDAPHEDDPGDPDYEDDGNSDSEYGNVEAEPEYNRASVWIHPAIEDEDFAPTFRHELFHIVLWGFSELAHSLAKTKTEILALEKAEERAVHILSTMRVWDEQGK